ncbi:TonB-dependent receptor plug domain-containing protein, partial [Pseudogemmobacter humi]|uniref:TonB-dependent receptor plug domain-containing protein n=1 Tax=Pseudogemmobacter humi TaxID=2483812 RepID=UPI001358B5BB
MISGCSRRLALLLATTGLCFGLDGTVYTPAWSQSVGEARHEFDISGRSVRQALNEIGRVSGVSVLFRETAAASRGAAPVRGMMSVSDAITAALSGTGLSWQFTDGNTVTIFGADSADASVSDGSVMLGTIVLSGGKEAISGAGFQGTPDWVYETPGAVSMVTQGAIRMRPPRNTADVIRDTSGVWVENDRRNAGTTVNIRGIGNNGRVVMTLDDARQNFRSLSGAQGLIDKAFIDPSFLRGIDIEKTRATGVGGAG